MKCHWCDLELESFKDDFGNIIMECSEIHSSIVFRNGEILSYSLFWDKDPEGKERYLMEYVNNITSVFQLYRDAYGARRRKSLFSTNVMIHPNLLTDVKKFKSSDEMERLIERLKRLRAFS